nr:MAG TPA: hypothetical protein [Caudoviricetes sp.]
MPKLITDVDIDNVTIVIKDDKLTAPKDDLAKKVEDLQNELTALKNTPQLPSPFKQWECKRVLKSSLPVISGAGNTATWRVTFDTQFTEEPIIMLSPFSREGVRAMWIPQRPTKEGFDLSASYNGADEYIHYLAFIPNK